MIHIIKEVPMKKKSNLSFGEQKVSQKGIFSIILGVISLIAAVVLVIISGSSRGKDRKSVV